MCKYKIIIDRPIVVEAPLLNKGDLIGPYVVYDEVGNGMFSRVYSGIHNKSRQLVALKVINPKYVVSNNYQLSSFELEFPFIHPNIASPIEVIKLFNTFIIVYELIEGIELDVGGEPWVCRKLEEIVYILNHEGTALHPNDVSRMFIQIGAAMLALHQNELAHLDIKPGNILIKSNGDFMLGDLGSVQSIAEVVSQIGSPNYMSPELFLSESLFADLADYYSLAATLFEALTGVLPLAIEASDYESAARIVSETEPDFSLLPPDTPEPLAMFIRRNLSKDPSMRSTAEEVEAFISRLEL